MDVIIPSVVVPGAGPIQRPDVHPAGESIRSYHQLYCVACCPDAEAQRVLRERLRVKYIGTTHHTLQMIGNSVRSGGVWYWLFIGTILFGYMNHWGLHFN